MAATQVHAICIRNQTNTLRFCREDNPLYVFTLWQEHQKWNYKRGNFAIDDVVLIVDQSMPRNMWPIGRIIKVYPDKKGYIRKVDIKTKTTILERPINKICLLKSSE